jgi:ribosome-associated protein
MTVLYIDADACPVKDEVYKVAARYGLKTFVVSNSWIRVPLTPAIEQVVVDAGPDIADDWIAERAGPGDVVITNDIPLADRVLKAGGQALGTTGRLFTIDTIGSALASRMIGEHLRSMGEVTSGPKAFGPPTAPSSCRRWTRQWSRRGAWFNDRDHPWLRIEDDEIVEKATRASGPGGQHVNKTSTAIELRFDVRNSPTLPEDVKTRLEALAGSRLTQDGVIVLFAQGSRSQEMNRQEARDRLVELIRRATEKPKPRRPTKPTYSSKLKRLETKGKRAGVKALRGRPKGDD